MPHAICPQAKLTPTANESLLTFITLNTSFITVERSSPIPRAARELLDLRHFRKQTSSSALFIGFLVLEAVIAH